MADPVPPSVQPNPAAPAKKGMGVFPKIMIGCAGLLVLAGILISVAVWWGARKLHGLAGGAEKNPAAFAARLMATGNPDIEVTAQDDAHQTVTLRNKKTGESLTLNASQLKEGKLGFRNEKGEEVTIEGNAKDEKGGMVITSKGGTTAVGDKAAAVPLPDWVPTYPGAKPAGVMANQGPSGQSGMFAFKTADKVDKVVGQLEEQLKEKGFEVERTLGDAGGALQAQQAGGARSVSVTVMPGDEGTDVTVIYESKKQ